MFVFILLSSFLLHLSPLPEALKVVIEAAKPGVSVLSLCEKGDAYIMTETGKVFKKEKDMKKGKREEETV